jgi:hypothetical protein
VTTNAGSGFDKLPILAELRDRLNEHYRASAHGPQKHPRLVRSRRWRPLALIAALVLGGATGALAAAGIFQSPSVIQRSNIKYLQPAVLRAINSPICVRRTVPATTAGVPPASLLSILGVLRRPAATGGIRGVLSRFGEYTGLYVKHVRFARTVDGFDWYVTVSAGLQGMRGPGHINRCIAAQTANFDRELPGMPKAFRADATQIFTAQIHTERSHAAYNPPISVNLNLNGFSEYGDGGTGGGAGTAAQIEDGKGLGTGGLATGSGPDTTSVQCVVPDGVASVTLHYNAGPVSGYSHKQVPAANITTKPVNNVIVVTVPRAGGEAVLRTMIWRAANGKIITYPTRSASRVHAEADRLTAS